MESIRWKQLVRAGWYGCAAIALAIFILSVAAQMIAPTATLHLTQRVPDLSTLGYGLLSIFSLMTRTGVALISLVLAGILFKKRSDERMTLFLSFFLLVYGVVEAGLLVSLDIFWHGLRTFTWSVLQPLIFAPFLIAFLTIFPNGRPVPSWTRWLILATIVYAPISSFLLVRGADSDPTILSTGAVLLWFALIITGLYTQFYRYHQVSSPTEQLQTKWVLYGFSLAFLFVFLVTVTDLSSEHLALEIPVPWLELFGAIGWSLALATLPLSLTIAVLRYRLFDIDFIINRTLVYGASTVCVVALYALTVGVLSLLFQTQADPMIALLATGLVAVLFQPLREYLQAAVNRVFYGQRDNPLLALSQLGKRLEAAITPEDVLPTLVQTIAHSLKLPYVAISLQSGDKFKITAESGDEVNDTITIPLIYQGETIGQLIAGSRESGEPLNQADRKLLNHLAHLTGPSAYALQLTQDLRQSRVRLVTAREEERRRLRRDLHDGLGPVLASQGLKMAAAGQLLQDNPTRARRLLEELAAQNEATVAEIRRLVYELRPAALDDLGLVGAVRDYALALKNGNQEYLRLQIDVQTPVEGLPALPAAIEVAAYRIATEALTNIARHAQARRATISFDLYPGNHARKLHLEIADDGIGLPQDHKSGIGLISMRERAEEVGGNFFIESSTGRGMCVVADLPLAEAT